jgi:anti-sigma-K factor RskA
MTCQDFEELLGAYVLGALTPEERRGVKEHLAQCPECIQKLQELQAVANLLPLTVPDVEPAADLKARFFSQIESANEIKKQPSKLPIALSTKRKPPTRRNVGWIITLLASAAIIFLCLSGGLIAWNLSLQNQIADLAKNVVHTTSYAIQGTTVADTAKGDLTCYTKQGICTLIVRGLPQPENNHIYQGWLLRGKQPTSIGLLNVQNGVAILTFQGSTTGFDTAAISLEPGPAASKDAPKGQVFAAGTLKTSSTT